MCKNNLVVGNTLFQHHTRRLWTWMSPGDRVRNQIDYIMIGRRWQSSLQNVKTRPGADCGSDHQLLVATFQLKLSEEHTNHLSDMMWIASLRNLHWK